CAERLPDLLDALDELVRCLRKDRFDLAEVLREVAVGLADDEPQREERHVAIGRKRAHRINDAFIGCVQPLDHIARRSREPALCLATILPVHVRTGGTPALTTAPALRR